MSIAYDLYLEVRGVVEARVKQALQRNNSNWDLRHNCPACMNECVEDPHLKFGMMWCADGNDSLKRLDRREAAGKGMLGVSLESINNRVLRGNMYIPRSNVDYWSTRQAVGSDEPLEVGDSLSSNLLSIYMPP